MNKIFNMTSTSKETEKSNFTSKYLSPCRTIGLKRKSKSPSSILLSKKINTVNRSDQDFNSPLNIKDSRKSDEISPSSTWDCYSSNKLLPSSNIDSSSQDQVVENEETWLLQSSSAGTSNLNRDCLPSSANNSTSCTNIYRDLASNKYNGTQEIRNVNFISHTFSPHVKMEDLKETPKMNTPKSVYLKSFRGKKKTVKLRENDSEKNNENGSPEPDVSGSIKELVLRIDKKFDRLRYLKNNQVYKKKHDVKELAELCETWKRVCVEVVERLHSQLVCRGETSISLADLIKTHSIPPELISYDHETGEFT